jgi:hypothetical protein
LKGMHTSMEIFLTDSEGVALTRQQVIDRLCQYDVCMLMRNINLEDYDWLSDIRERGFKGYRNYTDEELREEWLESEAGWSNMIADGEQPYDIVSTKETA